ncbi:type II CRISPR RNA-guided endonuclease Cas9 [Chryseobacterium nematophagum]|nr:type II CRISPR RNA-guided endonuclease Cas9 [Chryseobacterium nematophagum]
MKKIIVGLDIGVSSVGVAILEEDNNKKIIKELAVRIIPEDPNFHGKFYSGNTASKNLPRTTSRGIRRGYQRTKLRKNKLYIFLKELDMYPDENLMKLDVLNLYKLRNDSLKRKLSLHELGRVLIHLNQRRGFLSNRKSKTTEENSSDYKQAIAQLEKRLESKTIGEQLYTELLESDNIQDKVLRKRTYLRSSYIEEFNRIWNFQSVFYPEVLTGNSESKSKKNIYYKLKNEILFYQRPLKSQKGLVSNCAFEKGHKAISKSSPYFELFRIWQKVNDLEAIFENGEKYKPTLEQKQILVNNLFKGIKLNSKFKLSAAEIKKILSLSGQNVYLNFPELDGSRTHSMIKKAMENAGLDEEKCEKYLHFHPYKNDDKGSLFELWHITYSLPTDEEIINTLQKRFALTEEQAITVANEVSYNSDYGSLSTKAIKKILPFMEKGLGYSDACDKIGYDHSGYKTKIELMDRLQPILKNSLRNPVVEQVLNQVVNVINLILHKYGKIDEIRVELARELRNSAKQRKRISLSNSKNRKENDKIRELLVNEYQYKIVNGRDIQRYRLWLETERQCLYCNKEITMSDFISGQADLEHILPKSRSFTNNMSNFILAHKKCNSTKNQLTAYDFMNGKNQDIFEQYLEKVNELYSDGKGKINKAKFDNLICKGEDIPSDFVERMKKDTQYISKETVKLLKNICENISTTTGQVTDFLREKWMLKEIMQEVNYEKYKLLGLVDIQTIKDGVNQTKEIQIIKDWSKRDDHRHHAVDALICALTDQKIIFKLNNLNKFFQYERSGMTKEELESNAKFLNVDSFDLKAFADQIDDWSKTPIDNLREEVRKHLESIFISIKKSSKVLSKNINKPKNSSKEQITWTPRGRLHEETVMGRIRRIAEKKEKLNQKFNNVENIVDLSIKELIAKRVIKYGNLENAFSSKNRKDDPLIYQDNELKEVSVYENICVKRVSLNENFTNAQLEKIVDQKIKEKIIRPRIEERGVKKAFSNLDEDPIWLNKEKGIQIKSVKVYEESKVEKVRNGFVKTGGNHHALIYLDDNGKFNEKVISFWDAVEIGKFNISQTGRPYPIINRSDDAYLGSFKFSMQINDLFVLDFKHSTNPLEENELDFFDPKNRSVISKKLFRLQKMSKKSSGQFQVDFRHHLESTIDRNSLALRNITWEIITSNTNLMRLQKIKITHLGEIIKVGE